MNDTKGFLLTLFIGLIIGFIFGVALGYKDCGDCKDNTTPVERIEIDTFYITRDSIIEKTKYIKIIQHDTIEKVYNLNDSSTVDLFYKLVSE